MLRQQLFTHPQARSIFLHPTAKWQTLAGNSITKQNGINHLFFYDEEAKEFWDAVEQDDEIEKLDALGDMIFVAWGITHHLKLSEPMAATQMSILYVLQQMDLAQPYQTAVAVFEEVVRSNFSKFCKTKNEAIKTVAHYANTLNVSVCYQSVDDFFIIRSNADQTGSDGKIYRKDKILKSILFSEPCFKKILKTIHA